MFITCPQYKWLGLNEHGCQVYLSYHRNAQTPDIRSNVKTLTARWWMNSLRLKIKHIRIIYIRLLWALHDGYNQAMIAVQTHTAASKKGSISLMIRPQFKTTTFPSWYMHIQIYHYLQRNDCSAVLWPILCKFLDCRGSGWVLGISY